MESLDPAELCSGPWSHIKQLHTETLQASDNQIPTSGLPAVTDDCREQISDVRGLGLHHVLNPQPLVVLTRVLNEDGFHDGSPQAREDFGLAVFDGDHGEGQKETEGSEEDLRSAASGRHHVKHFLADNVVALTRLAQVEDDGALRLDDLLNTPQLRGVSAQLQGVEVHVPFSPLSFPFTWAELGTEQRVEGVQQCPRELARVLGELQQLADQRWDGVGGDGLQDLTQLGEYLNLNRGTQTQRLNKRLN